MQKRFPESYDSALLLFRVSFIKLSYSPPIASLIIDAAVADDPTAAGLLYVLL